MKSIVAIGLLAVGVSAIGVMIYMWWKMKKLLNRMSQDDQSQGIRELLKWTPYDYTILGLFGMGMIYLLIDLYAVIRDKEQFPDFHFTYLLSGIVLVILAAGIWLNRTLWVIRAFHTFQSINQQHTEPTKTDPTKYRI